jgi:transcription elongation factor Elf1
MLNILNGLMTPQWTVWCSNCNQWNQVSLPKGEATKYFKSIGWVKKNKKWVCPDCNKEKT